MGCALYMYGAALLLLPICTKERYGKDEIESAGSVLDVCWLKSRRPEQTVIKNNCTTCTAKHVTLHASIFKPNFLALESLQYIKRDTLLQPFGTAAAPIG